MNYDAGLIIFVHIFDRFEQIHRVVASRLHDIPYTRVTMKSFDFIVDKQMAELKHSTKNRQF